MSVPRILIVEDDRDQSKRMARIIKDIGYKVAERVRTASGAIAILSKTQVDLAIIDIKLIDDDVGGIKVAKHINEYHKIPFIFLTGLKDERLDLEAKETGYMNFLDKPFEDRALKRAINDALYPPGSTTLNEENSDEKLSTQIEYKKGSSWCWIKEKSYSHKVKIDHVHWIKGDGQHCSVHIFPEGVKGQKRKYEISHRLRLAEERFKGHPYLIRINQSYIVNITKITKRTSGNGIVIAGLNEILSVTDMAPADFWDRL